MAENKIITISREYGSSGREIAQLLSEKLELPFYDKEIIEIASKKSGYASELFKEIDEIQKTSLLFSIAMNVFPFASRLDSTENMSFSDKLFEIEKRVIIDTAKKGPCVIVGRCSNYILKNDFNTLNIFIHLNLEDRISNISKKNNISIQKAKELVSSIDRTRSSYYKYYTGEKWGAKENYDLIINSSVLGIDGTVELIQGVYKA